jgi:hypothetical protein
MGTILLLALAAAVYPQLLAVVVIILTRPAPRPLLLASYLGSFVVSVAAGVAIVAVFRSRETIAGTSSRSIGSATYLAVGSIALVLAIALSTTRGRELLDRGRPLVRRRAPRKTGDPRGVAKLRSRAELALHEGSLVVAVLVGALLAVPGPFDFLALGRLARGGYGPVATGATIVGFTVIKFALIEIPIASYALDPAGTATRVGRFSGWMRANKLAIVAVVIGGIGIGLLATGFSRLR